MLYNVPSRTSLNMTDATTVRLSDIDNIIGIKEASSDPGSNRQGNSRHTR